METSPLEKLHFGKKSLGLWLILTKKHGSLIRAFNSNNTHKAFDHYPSEDILSNSRNLQYFYHSHRDTGEHGHIHVFSNSQDTSTTNHLLAIGLSEKGLPISLFTVDAASINEKQIDAKTLERLLSQALKKTQKETQIAKAEPTVTPKKKVEVAKVEEPKQEEFKPENKDIDNDAPVIEIAQNIIFICSRHEILQQKKRERRPGRPSSPSELPQEPQRPMRNTITF